MQRHVSVASEVHRAQRTHPEYKKPELMATAPNQVWSWDITRLLGPKKWSYYYLYVIMDIYSRYVVGWMVADRENSALAGLQQSCLKHGVQPRVLTLHSNDVLNFSLTSATLSRPQVSGSVRRSLVSRTVRGSGPSQDVLSGWYNAEHRHGGSVTYQWSRSVAQTLHAYLPVTRHPPRDGDGRKSRHESPCDRLHDVPFS